MRWLPDTSSFRLLRKQPPHPQGSGSRIPGKGSLAGLSVDSASMLGKAVVPGLWRGRSRAGVQGSSGGDDQEELDQE